METCKDEFHLRCAELGKPREQMDGSIQEMIGYRSVKVMEIKIMVTTRNENVMVQAKSAEKGKQGAKNRKPPRGTCPSVTTNSSCLNSSVLSSVWARNFKCRRNAGRNSNEDPLCILCLMPPFDPAASLKNWTEPLGYVNEYTYV